MSSASDSLASPQRFTRARSIRLREKLALSASMADLPEEEAAPITSLAESTGEAKTPVDAHKGSSRRTSIVWSTLRSKSRIFGSKKVGDGTPLSGSIKVRGSNSNLAGDQVRGTPAGILKRSSTNSKDRYRLPPSIARRCSDVSGIVAAELERQVRVEERRKDAEEARMYMEKVLVSREPIMQILYRDGYDAVVVDVSATGLPVSSIAKDILCGDSGNELHKIGMFKPYKDGVLKTQPGKPDIIYIVSEKDEEPDKRVRVGVATGMREAFGCEQLKKIVLYPFCISHEEPFTDYVIQQFLLASFKAFTWNQKEKFDGSLTLAGVTEENCAQIHRLYEEFLNLEIRTRITAYENLSLPATEKKQTEDVDEQNASSGEVSS
uniref:SAM-dependent MTase TRM10-type domain-containing protein n=1 Tax=Angiostrongylus cantonensis TaxID=6313 RepID=A0A0K0CXN6_ANGCA